MRLDPNRGPGPFPAAYSPTRLCSQVQEGNKGATSLAGGCHPRFIRNLGTGENPCDWVHGSI